ncbi:MAG: PepSY domain-containing protein [Acidobacteria bacterium]|nr:PepSY domain-containing protein [Acidobacteriota bacterium]
MTTWLLALHDNLLFGETGRDANGVGSVLLTVLAVTGAVIWWPGVAGWRRALGVDLRANWRRLIWTLHGAVGVWTVVFILMWGLTGIYLAIPEPFNALADAIEPFDEETFEPRTVDNVLYWVARVHFGRFGGWSTKALWAAIGLLPPVLFVTGFVMWWTRVVRPLQRGRPLRPGTPQEPAP